MTSSTSSQSVLERLADEVRTTSISPVSPLTISPWLAMALLQKSIRRGHDGFALQAASTLLEHAPEKLWRRLGGIAFEDVGFAEMEAVAVVTAALGGKLKRAKVGSDWAIASCLVRRLVQANKSRAADDLLMVSERLPVHQPNRMELAEVNVESLLSVATGDGPVPRRAIAAQYAVGIWRSRFLRPRRGDPTRFFDHLLSSGYPAETVELCRVGYSRTREMLCPLLALLSPHRSQAKIAIVDDEMPPVATCGPVPSWAIDVYSREGREAFRQFLDRDCQTTRWIIRQVSPRRRESFLGGLVFGVEGQMMRRRERWGLAEDLRRCVTIECQGPECCDATEVLSLLRDDWPLLNQVRANVV